MKITTAHYHTPKGKDINEVGIEPNQKVEFEGRSLGGDDDNQFLGATEQLLKELEAIDTQAAESAGMPTARTGVEQWRYLNALGRGEPKILERNYLFQDGEPSLIEEIKVLFPDASSPEIIRFDLGPALGISS